jgi:spore coat polysaccharide biosynthesis predicted glycosyltransferase SpsG/CMP-N-acetylneuraminic acid synthetase
MAKKLILILARENTQELISKQNLHLVNDKPLLYYILKNCLEYKKADIYVSTDSEMIKTITTFYGCNFIDRPKRLTKNDTSVFSIVHNALLKLKTKGLNYDSCFVISPNYPLFKKKTIESFFSNLSNNVKSIVGYEEFKINENFVNISSNQKNLNKLLKINKKIVKLHQIFSFDCDFLLKEKKIQQNFGISIPKSNLINLEDYHSFSSLEKILSRKKILVRVDGSKLLGLGHIFNILTILNRLRQFDILIVMHNKRKMGFQKIKEYNFELNFFSNSSEFKKILNKYQPDIVFNDILNTEISYMKQLKNSGCFVVNFEDLGKGNSLADLVFNPIYYGKSKKNHYYGNSFACVRDEFRFLPPHNLRKKVSHIVISFGGTDPTNKTYDILKILLKYPYYSIKFTVILGFGYNFSKKLFSLINEMKKNGYNIDVVERSDYLANQFRNADFAITSNGRTVFELASLNVPCISIPVNSRESKHSFITKEKIGYQINSKLAQQFPIIFEKMLDYNNRKEFDRKLKKLKILNGLDRVIKIILKSHKLYNYNQLKIQNK